MLIVAVVTGVALVGAAWIVAEATKMKPSLQPAKAPVRRMKRP